MHLSLKSMKKSRKLQKVTTEESSTATLSTDIRTREVPFSTTQKSEGHLPTLSLIILFREQVLTCRQSEGWIYPTAGWNSCLRCNDNCKMSQPPVHSDSNNEQNVCATETISDCDSFYICYVQCRFPKPSSLEFWSQLISHDPQSHCNQSHQHSCVSTNCTTVQANHDKIGLVAIGIVSLGLYCDMQKAL